MITSMPDKTEQSIIDALLLSGGNSSAEVVKNRKAKGKRAKTQGLLDFDMIPQKKGFEDKPVEQWNKVDLRHYFENCYLKMFGSRPIYTIPFFYSATNVVTSHLGKALNQKTVKPEVMKRFYDFYFEEHMHRTVQKYGFFKLEWMGWQTVVQEFAKQMAFPADLENDDSPKMELISVDELEKKAKVSFQGAVLAYGVIIMTNWVAKAKGVSIEKARGSVETVAIKAVQSDRRFWVNIVSATERYGPYPKWLAWKDANVVTVAVEAATGTKLERIQVKTCDDNQSLGFLKTK